MKKNFIKETKSELKKVVWPSKKDVINGTVVVAVMVILVGAIILAFDFLSSGVIKAIISGGESSVTDMLDEDDHNHEEENNIENTDNTVENNSEPTIDNNVVTE